jgi:hypothetical protein
VIVRLLLWRLADVEPSLEDVRERLEGLEPLTPPSTWLWNEASERFGVLLLGGDDLAPPEQVREVRELLGREPDLYEDFDALG